ncbi:hypothetical protein [Clostridium beijerinckii]|uniref:hypothetical protein n=1 Tax=Clostridium beijerinckii TaxID=1520 RepID=UPI00156EB1E4|nr:hypothetical protein [Clostridium beijerinckii]NRT73622.1 hypothetical protein [Clostridium beijerinckii]
MAKEDYTKQFLELVYQPDEKWTSQHIKNTVDALNDLFCYEELEGVTPSQYREVCKMLIEILDGEMSVGSNDIMCNTEVRSCLIEISKNLGLQTNEDIKECLIKYTCKA